MVAASEADDARRVCIIASDPLIVGSPWVERIETTWASANQQLTNAVVRGTYVRSGCSWGYDQVQFLAYARAPSAIQRGTARP